LANTQVLIHDPSLPSPILAPLYFVSPGQINFQVPFEVVGNTISITVSNPQGTSKPFAVSLSPMAPGIFSQDSNGLGTALVFDPNFRALTAPPPHGSTIVLYATGLGVTNPPATSGMGGSDKPPLNQVAGNFDVYVGGSKATVSWAGLAPGLTGVYQLNVIPAGEAAGAIAIVCDSGSSNILQVPQAPLDTGANTANVIGSVTILYPNSQDTLAYSPAAVVAEITAKFDILPNAGGFTLSTSAMIGPTTVDGTAIQFYPAQRIFSGTVPSPTVAVRIGDFSQTGVQALDFLNMCGGSPCPFPGSIVPVSQLPTSLYDALRLVLLPNSSTGVHSFLNATGAANAGTTFVFGGNSSSELVRFASFGAVPYPSGSTPVTVTLSIDGRVIASATSAFLPPKQ
jgi:uncharacterized protein (TIGR03437 family)